MKRDWRLFQGHRRIVIAPDLMQPDCLIVTRQEVQGESWVDLRHWIVAVSTGMRGIQSARAMMDLIIARGHE